MRPLPNNYKIKGIFSWDHRDRVGVFEAIGKTQEALKRKERPRRAVRREAVRHPGP